MKIENFHFWIPFLFHFFQTPNYNDEYRWFQVLQIHQKHAQTTPPDFYYWFKKKFTEKY